MERDVPVNFVGNISVFQKQQFDEAMLYLTRASRMADIAHALASQNVNITLSTTAVMPAEQAVTPVGEIQALYF
ncbi:hypothetical protein DPH57_01455 [Massilia sp. YMA4]|nr:hypothetical protein DPH57_01455 [Massilia sp. YMA4]